MCCDQQLPLWACEALLLGRGRKLRLFWDPLPTAAQWRWDRSTLSPCHSDSAHWRLSCDGGRPAFEPLWQSGDAQKCLWGTWAWQIWYQQVQEWASGIWIIIVKWPLCTSALELEEILVKMRKHSDSTWLDNNLWDSTSPWIESLRISTNHGLPWWSSG